MRFVLCAFVAFLSIFDLVHAQTENMDLGIGMAIPQMLGEQPLYFYGSPNPGAHPSAMAPADSLTFRTGANSIELGYGPPWLDGEAIRLDYDMVYFRAITVSDYWVEVIVNSMDPLPRTFPRTMWVNRDAVELRLWPQFFLDIHSVEPIDFAANPLRSGPGEETADMGTNEGDIYHVIAVQGSWMLVASADFRESGTPRGWIRWNDGERLLVRFNLLS